MRAFSGAEPLVGEIVGLRTFQVDESGLLMPLYASPAWYDGTNTATCSPPTGGTRCSHPVPSPECECGFYAYGNPAATAQHRQARYVLAAVSCWGSVIAGTQGVRAEHARIDAIWLHPNSPAWVRRRVASRYPSAAMYTERDALLAEHPPTELPCYEPRRTAKVRSRIFGLAAILAVLLLGLIPGDQLQRSPLLWAAWLSVTGALAAVTCWLVVGAHGPGHLSAALVAVSALAWLVAPLFGLSGWLLRAPVLRGLAVAGTAALVRLRPGYFPVVHARRERAFCGVRA